jgi:hypothetical protein
MTSKLDWDLNKLFLFLANSTLCIDDYSKQKVFNDMAYKLIEWNNTSRCELRGVFRKFDIRFEELCSNCNEEIELCEDIENPLCNNCLV